MPRDPLPALRWYALAVETGREKDVASRLKAADIEHWLPLEEIWCSGRGRTKGTYEQVPLFPGYLLPRLDLSKPHASIEDDRDVIGLVRGASIWPSPIPERAIDLLRSLAGPTGVFYQPRSKAPKNPFTAHQAVRAIEGAWSGWSGKILELRGSERVQALFGPYPVDMAIGQLVPA